MVVRKVIMWVAIGFALVLTGIGVPLFFSDTGDLAIGSMFAMFVWFVAFVFALVAVGAWIAGRNNTGPRETSLHL